MSSSSTLPDHVPRDDAELDELLSRPTPALIESLGRRIEGDIVVLGVAGKMGVTLALSARRALDELAAKGGGAPRRRVVGVARFSNPRAREQLEAAGVETIVCDLLDREAVAELPRAPNVVFMAGRKFGTEGDEELTWAMNVLVPANVAEHYRDSRIVAFSTGCVYDFVAPESGGSLETDAPNPVGEYASSCLGRERVFQYFSRARGTPVCLFRLNYAIDLRYGVLHDIGRRILDGEAIDLGMGHFNCIWQRDANDIALRALEHCASPARALNVTRPEIYSIRDVATRIARELDRESRFTGENCDRAYLSNPSRAIELFGAPVVGIDEMIRLTAGWLRAGGGSLEKPTHFEVRDGRY